MEFVVVEKFHEIIYLIKRLRCLQLYQWRCRCPWGRQFRWGTRRGREARSGCCSSERSRSLGFPPDQWTCATMKRKGKALKRKGKVLKRKSFQKNFHLAQVARVCRRRKYLRLHLISQSNSKCDITYENIFYRFVFYLALGMLILIIDFFLGGGDK